MKYALNQAGKRISIRFANKEETYFCPYCKEVVIQKKGTKNDWHFCHKNAACSMSLNAPKITPPPGFSTIPDIWNKYKPSVMIVQNTLTERKFRIHSDPNVTIYKYGKCYGYMSSEDGNFGKGTRSTEIFRFDIPIWKLLWYKKPEDK